MEWKISPGAIPTEVFSGNNDEEVLKKRKPKSADYALFIPNLPRQPIAIVEAKKNALPDNGGLQQAKNYAQMCGAKFAYSSSGHHFVEYDFFTGKTRTIPLNAFPSPSELWSRYEKAKKYSAEAKKIIAEPYAMGNSNREPRYYQARAINSVVEAFATGKKRALLVMATGTGKTFTAFQIVSRLINSGKVRHVLYLADRNVLVDQAKNNDFQSLEKISCKISSRKLDPAYKIYFALYQQLIETGANGEIIEHFKDVASSFFDLIVIDECHRGSAKDDSTWHKILDYFQGAFHLGLTATPRETDDVSNIDYFGEPVYVYSLKDGIADGFLAPYEVLSCELDVDANGFSPSDAKSYSERGELIDEHGNVVPEGSYSAKDFEKNIVLRARTKRVAQRIAACLRAQGEFSKTIVFCVDTEHAARLRDAIANEFSDIVKKYPNYVVRITGDDPEGKNLLDAFCDATKKEPTIATTSQLLSTGVDCRTCRLVVLDKNIGSMTEFKQIIGRGTRLAPQLGKTHFSILDFRKNTWHFSDPDFDGEPVQAKDFPSSENSEEAALATNVSEDNSPDSTLSSSPFDPEPAPRKYYVGENEISVDVATERISFVDPRTGKLVNEDLVSYSKKNMRASYASLKDFIKAWNANRRDLIDYLPEHGVFIKELREKFKHSQYGNADEFDDFDILCHYIFDVPAKSKSERARAAKKSVFLKNYTGLARAVLESLIDKYASANLLDFENPAVFDTDPIRDFGTTAEIVQSFGGKTNFRAALANLVKEIYA